MALTSAACRRTLEDLLTCDRLRDPRFTWIINCAKRKLPAVPFTMPAATSQVLILRSSLKTHFIFVFLLR